MIIEIEMVEEGGFIVRNSKGKIWVAREYSLLSRIREAFGLETVKQFKKRQSKKLPSESLPPTPDFSKKV